MGWSQNSEMERPRRALLGGLGEMAAQVRTDIVKMPPADHDDEEETSVLKAREAQLVEGDETTQHEMDINPQYLELERSEPDGHPQLVKVAANGQLVPCEMLQHVGPIETGEQHHGLVVHVLPPHPDLKEATEYYAPNTPQQLHRSTGSPLSPEDRATLSTAYLAEQLNAHYEEDLLAHELTDDDRKLAAALVAVQYSHPHRHHLQKTAALLEHSGMDVCASGVETNVIMNVNDGMHSLIAANQLGKVGEQTHGMSDMVVEYIHQVEGTQSPIDVSRKPTNMRMLSYHPDTHVLQSHEGNQLHTLDDGNVHAPHFKTITHAPPILKKVLSSQMSPRARYKRSLGIEEVDIDSSQQVELHDMVTESAECGNKAVDQSVCLAVKNEKDYDDDDPDFDSEEAQDDSDYDVESEIRSSRRSLPHKKRIPRKLKNPKKSGEKNSRTVRNDETFPVQGGYDTNNSNNAKKLFNCELCSKNFPNQLKFFEHLKSHYEPILVPVVPEENMTLAVEDTVKQEAIFVQDLPPALPPPLTCDQCGKVFRRQKALETHINMSHGQIEEEEDDEVEEMEMIPEDIDEDDVEKKDWYPSDLQQPSSLNIEADSKLEHSLEDMQEETLHEIPEVNLEATSCDHLCDNCGDSFELKSQLTLHMREEHPETKRRSRRKVETTGTVTSTATGVSRKWEQLTCPTCGRMFNHRNSLVYHLRSHTGERPHQCEVCGKSFFAASALKVHMRLHSGDKPYKCELCGRHFRQWGDLKYHCISIHTDEKQYQCEYCGKDFARKYSLIVHRRIHTGEKNYKCEFCGKTFRASSYLQNHRRIHTGEKPHPCDVCGKPFRVRSDMKRHMQTHNREGAAHGGGSAPANPGSQSSQSSCGGRAEAEMSSDTQQVELHELDPATTEITIQDGEVSVLPDDGLTSSQPIDLNIRVPGGEACAGALPDDAAHASQQISEAQQLSAEEVQEEVLQYARDPLETVRDGSNTLYVWPIYMA